MALGRPILQDAFARRARLRTRPDRIQRSASQTGARSPRRRHLRVKNDGGTFDVEVLALSEIRGPATVAQTLYRETEASREARRKLAEERKMMPSFETTREGKPSKRDRRVIDRLRGR